MSSAFRRLLVVSLSAAVLAVVLTWPLAAQLDSAGRVDSSDARHGIWNVAWVAHALTSDPASLFNANIFYPHPSALAFSEANLVAGVLAIPVWLLTEDALAAGNFVIILSFVLSALATFLLVQHLTRSTTAAAASAMFFAYSPYAFSRLGHMQLLMTFGMPLTLWAMHRFVEVPAATRAFTLGLTMAVSALACGYYGIFVGLSVGWGLVWFGVSEGRWRRASYWLLAAGALAVAALVTMPFLIPYVGIRDEGFARSLDDARLFSADWRSYFASPKLLHEWMLPLLGSWRKVLFPGALVLAFAAATVTVTLRAKPGDFSAGGRRVIAFYVSVATLAAWASFGPDAGLYALLFYTLPFFELIRAPGRFGVIVTLALSVLAAYSIAWIFERLAGWRRRRRAFLGVLVILTLITSTVGPLDLSDRRPVARAYQRLAQMPRGPLIEFPYFIGPDRHRHTEYMLESTLHWLPLLNGYSDHMPPETYADSLILNTFPNPQVWDVVRRRGARYVTVHWYDYPDGGRTRAYLFGTEVGRRLRLVVDGDVSLFELMPEPSRTP